MAKVYMIGAMKGGTGKTTTTFNLAYALHSLGERVLAVDLDPQGNLSTCFGITEKKITIGDLMMLQMDEEELPEQDEYINKRNGVDFIPADIQLSAVDSKLRLEMGSEYVLSVILESLKTKYDVILLDTGPSLGSLNINAMAAADAVIITANPQLLAMTGLQDFLKIIRKVHNRINGCLDVAGILLTMCDGRTRLCRNITKQVEDAFDGRILVFHSRIPSTVKVGESIYNSKPLCEYAPGCNAHMAYNRLAKEVAAL